MYPLIRDQQKRRKVTSRIGRCCISSVDILHDTGHIATKDQFADRVASYASISKEVNLFTGIHYGKLAKFLKTSTPQTPTKNRGASHNEGYPFVVMQTYDNKGPEITEHHDAAHLKSSIEQYSSDTHPCHLLFLRGFPSTDWLNALGATFRLDPEYMRRHLDFMQSPDFYDLPSLPSSSSNMLRLRMITICKRSSVIGYGSFESKRRNETEEVRKHQSQLLVNRNVGASIVRRISNHDEMTYTIEQEVSCFVKHQQDRTLGNVPEKVGHIHLLTVHQSLSGLILEKSLHYDQEAFATHGAPFLGRRKTPTSRLSCIGRKAPSCGPRPSLTMTKPPNKIQKPLPLGKVQVTCHGNTARQWIRRLFAKTHFMP